MARTNLHITDKVNFKCRNDCVLVRIVDKGKTDDGILLPEISVQGKEFIIVSKGSKVEDLEVGDKVLLTGLKNSTYFELPMCRDLILARECDVVLVVTPKITHDA